LGSNIGVTIAHMAVLHPSAEITGVELDPANHAVATGNIKPWAARCSVIQAAVWTEDGELHFKRQPGHEAGSRIADEGESVPALSLNSLLERTGPPDYVKMDVEGAERALLHTNTEWAQHVRSMKVEIHGGYQPDECIEDLAALGFRAELLPPPWWPPARGRPCLVATRTQ
jgi:FkbM family methyltransferase